MKKLSIIALLAGFLSALSTVHASPSDDAKVLVNSAMEHYKAHGQEKTAAAINDRNGPFIKGDLYLFMCDFNGEVYAHGGNNKLVGTNMIDGEDADGKPFMKAFIEQAIKGPGWVDYRWLNPTKKKIQDKSTFVAAVPSTSIFIGCGFYKSE